MKQWGVIAIFIIGLMLAWRGMKTPDYTEGYNIEVFAQLPVQDGGRIKPLDTIASNSLLFMRGKSRYPDAEGNAQPAIEWLLRLMLDPQSANDLYVFRVDYPDLVDQITQGVMTEKALMGSEKSELYYSWNELEPHRGALIQQAVMAEQSQETQTPYERAVLRTARAMGLYEKLANSFLPPASLAAGGADVVDLSERLQAVILADTLQIIPPLEAEAERWLTLGQSIAATLERGGGIDPILEKYSLLAIAWREQNPEIFSQGVEALQENYEARAAGELDKVGFEYLFNVRSPFSTSIALYIFILLLAAGSWLIWPQSLGKAAFWLLVATFLIHTFGLFARMYIQGRPPVTNLYSSAVFIGWFTVILCFILEWFTKLRLATAAASVIGIATLIIAHNLAKGGDTLEMMRAVLDSNFWLATHVITVTIGYCATFLAGILAAFFILLGLFTNKLDDVKDARLAHGMVYGVICFGLLFSFVGTVLGGVWADQSWGRFWGWDPKENGALMIVLWNALILHARWGKLARARGIMILCLIGSMVTAWSWFGTNLLGVGLHSYGFTESGFKWLMIFWISQLALVGLALIKPKFWGSPQAARA